VVDTANGLRAGTTEFVPAVDQQPQHHGGVLRGNLAEAAAAQPGHGDAVRVDRVSFAALPSVEHPHPRGQLRGHVQDRLAISDQTLRDVPADAATSLDRPDPVGEPAPGRERRPVAFAIGAVASLREHPFAVIDDLDRGRPLVRIHPDHHTAHVLASSWQMTDIPQGGQRYFELDRPS